MQMTIVLESLRARQRRVSSEEEKAEIDVICEKINFGDVEEDEEDDG